MKKFVAIILVLLPFGVVAEEATPPRGVGPDQAVNKWVGGIDLGFISTSGNTETETLTFGFDLGRKGENWNHVFHLEAFNNSSDGDRSAEKYLTYWQSNLKFNERQSIFFRGEYEEDKFGSFDYQGTVTVGYSHVVVDTDKHNLVLDAGPGYRKSKVTATQETEGEGIIRLAGDYNWKISQNAKFGQFLSAEKGSKNTVGRSRTYLEVNIVEALAVRLSYHLRWNKEVAPTDDNWDRETIVSVVYKW